MRVRYTDTGEPDSVATPEANAKTDANGEAAESRTGAGHERVEQPTVVLVHGFASALEVWAGVVPGARARPIA